MLQEKTTSERLTLFSDAVFAVIITIMVLDLKPPAEPTLRALLPLWPTALSYAVSYLFIAIIWVNHHHLMQFAPHATTQLIWWNFAHLFMVSLVPVTTAWVASTRLAAAPVFVYALVFVFIEIAYLAFERTALSQATEHDFAPRPRKIAHIRSGLALGLFCAAAIVSFWAPRVGFALVCCVLLIYLSPRLPELFGDPGK
jgi:TMEM175 potassium channel family protein